MVFGTIKSKSVVVTATTGTTSSSSIGTTDKKKNSKSSSSGSSNKGKTSKLSSSSSVSSKSSSSVGTKASKNEINKNEKKQEGTTIVVTTTTTTTSTIDALLSLLQQEKDGVGVPNNNMVQLPHSHPVITTKYLRPNEIKFHCQVPIPVHEIKYSIVRPVIDSWEQDVKVISNWDATLGERLLRNMFQMEPECIIMFGFPPETKYDDPKLSQDTKFVSKGKTFINMLDIALSLVGPDLEPLEEQLRELGGRHVSRHCKPKHFPMNGAALHDALEMLLGDQFTTEVQNGWIILFNFFGYHMIRGLIEKGGPTWDDN